MTESSDVDVEKMKIERERLEIDRQKNTLEFMARQADTVRAVSEQAKSVLEIVKYLNELRDENVSVVDEGYSKTTITRPSREWNPLEEQLANASVKTLCHLVGTMGGAKQPQAESRIE